MNKLDRWLTSTLKPQTTFDFWLLNSVTVAMIIEVCYELSQGKSFVSVLTTLLCIVIFVINSINKTDMCDPFRMTLRIFAMYFTLQGLKYLYPIHSDLLSVLSLTVLLGMFFYIIGSFLKSLSLKDPT